MAVNHGGKREGAGRPTKEPTKLIRVPVSVIPIIERYLVKKMLKS